MNKFLLFFIGLLSTNSFSQSQISNLQGLTEEKFKSPQVHLLKQFADQPVDLSRGLVDITIPIYDIPFANKTLPIKLMFHPSGLKADVTENGILGLKWALNAGGFISREVRGYPDEVRNHKQGIGQSYIPDWMTLYGGAADKGYFNNNNVYQNLGLQYIGMPAGVGKYEDTEYDIFTFSLPNGQSGKFILKDNNGSKSASFMPYKPYKLENPVVESYPLSTVNNFTYTKFEITDDEGYIYTFGKSDTNTAYYENSPNFDYINCWHLTSITSPNKKEVIKYEYIYDRVVGNSLLTPVIINDYLDEFRNYFNMDECLTAWRNSPLFDALFSTLYDSKWYFVKNYNEPPLGGNDAFYLSKITYNDLIVDFTYNNSTIKKLNQIKVSKASKIIKKVNFDITTPASTTTYEKPSYLNAVNVLDTDDVITEKYNFDYYNIERLPSIDKLFHSADYWGYYQSEVENVIIKDTVDIFWTPPSCLGTVQQHYRREIGSGNNRFSNSDDMKIGMIKSITYPTGGKTIFNYEANQYKDNANITKNCGGLRIKTIVDNDRNGSELKRREYFYGVNEDGIGEIPSYLKPDPNVRNSFEETSTTYYIDDTSIYVDDSGALVYPHDQGEGTYRTRYISGSFPASFYTFLQNIVYYNIVTEYFGDKNNNVGKTENYYNIEFPLSSEYEFNTNYFKYKRNKLAIDPSNFWNGNFLYKKIDYKKENELYSRVRQTDYLYETKIVDEFYDLSIFKYKDFIGYDVKVGTQTVTTASVELQRVKDNPGSFFGYKLQKYRIGVENLSSTREETFLNDGKSIVQTITNKYDTNKPTFLKETSLLNSKGKNIAQKFLYPFNINAGVYSQMSNANVIAPLIEKVTLSDDKVTASTLLTYKKSDNNFVPDQNIITELNTPILYSGFTNFNGTNKDSRYSSNSEIAYDLYDDFGNPTQITTKGKITTCYIWGYDKKYPIAKIENATYTTGQSNTITTAQQTLITNAINATVAENTTATEINLIAKLKLLRDGFPNAMVTTYTYDPLIGITSITDPKEYTTYYEYDTFGRLKQVKDKDGKILSANKYRYVN